MIKVNTKGTAIREFKMFASKDWELVVTEMWQRRLLNLGVTINF